MWHAPLPFALGPEQVALRLAREPGLAWLDGDLTYGREGRFSFLGVAPVEVCEARYGTAEPLRMLARLSAAESEGPTSSPLAPQDVPRWIGHIAYDAHPVERARQRHPRPLDLPCVRFARYDALVAFDHARGTAFIIGDDAPAGQRLISRLREPPLDAASLSFSVGALHETAAASHEAAIRTALAHIREGDVYQINLARRFAGPFSGAPLGLFLRMRAVSPVPLGYFCAAPDHTVLGRSMERFLRYRSSDRALWTSPIKGTVARTDDDRAAALALSRDRKEQAEHAMVIDLMRNDLSRVCVIGSVQVEEAFEVVPFAGLLHQISTVRGVAEPGLTLDQLLMCTFPPGSVTGTPKERALELIESLEETARGFYTGASGFVDRTGGLSLAVSIRTASVHAGMVEYFAGGGIVWGSDPERETRETELKAQAFFLALR